MQPVAVGDPLRGARLPAVAAVPPLSVEPAPLAEAALQAKAPTDLAV